VQQPIRILVVDDDQDLTRMFWLMLAKNGFEIMTAFDGETALVESRETRPDLVLLDIMLPGNLDGIEVCRQLRADPTLNSVSVVMVTARMDAETRKAAFSAGANDYWVKPIDRASLADRVRATLEAHRASLSHPVADAGVQPDNHPTLEPIVKMLAELAPKDLEEVRALVATKLAHRGT